MHMEGQMRGCLLITLFGSYLRDALQEGSADAVMLWDAFIFVGIKFFPPFFLLLGGLHCFFL
jgi:hypothetical protein